MKTKTIFAANENTGELFVRVDAVMNPLIPLLDGLRVAFFGKSRKTPYLFIDDAIEWCKKEATQTSGDPDDYRLRIAVMEKFKAQEAALAKGAK